MNFLLTWFLFISLYHLQVDTLQCNSCSYDTFLNQTVCNNAIENCTAPDLKFCSTNMEERPDGSKTFTRGCVPSKVCKTDYCETYIINSLGRTSCDITCCQEDLCNRDGYILPGNSGWVSPVHWCLFSACSTAISWMSLSGGCRWS